MKIKPLEWEETANNWFDAVLPFDLEASIFVLFLSVYWVIKYDYVTLKESRAKSIEEAKNACQRYYERELLAVLKGQEDVS